MGRHEVMTTSLGLLRPKLSPWFVLLVLLHSSAHLALSGCGKADQGASLDGDQVGSGFSDDTVRRLTVAIAKQMRVNDLPGVVVGVWVPGEGEYVVARGKANLRTGEKRDLDDPFRIGSITKTFVATAILQLVEEGKLSKTDKLAKWYPHFPNAHKITLEHLLRMQSGIVDPPWEATFLEGLTPPQETFEASVGLGDAFLPPGQRTQYTNVNYVILGEVVGKVSGKDTGDQIAESILEPLGMKDTIYPTTNDLPGDLHGYTLAHTEEPKAATSFNPSAEGGAASMISDVSDLKTWAEAVCTGNLLKSETQRARLRTHHLPGEPDSVGYGEGIYKVGEFCGHGGRQPGFSNEMWYLPEKDATIVVSVNREDEPDSQRPSVILLLDIIEILFP